MGKKTKKMDMFDFLSDVVKGVVKKAGKKTTRHLLSGSALPPGRMRKTDKIKGGSSPLPSLPGIYRHINKKTGNVDYVGQTDNLRKRQQEHARTGKLNTAKQYVQYGVSKSGTSKNDLCNTEVNHIARCKPSGNTTKGGNGRR